MTFVTGFSPQESGSSALELVAVLARSTGQEAVVAVVVATPHLMAVVDASAEEYVDVLAGWAETSLERARAALPDDVPARFVVRRARSIPAGLEELVEENDASALVLGSSTKGHQGRISLGSITDRMTHGARVPVALAPHGYRAGPESRIGRVTVAYAEGGGSAHLLGVAQRWATDAGVPLRVVSLVVQPRPIFAQAGVPVGVPPATEDLVTQQWVRRWRDSFASDVAALDPSGGLAPGPLEVGVGDSWRAAMQSLSWSTDEVLLVGSSGSSPAARVFLGSRGSKILRHSPVPVVVVPGG